MPVKSWSVGDVLTAADVDAWLAPLAGVKSANQTINSNTTLINDADMRFAMAANSLYEFHVYARYSSPHAPGDFKSSLTLPAGGTARFQRVGKDQGGTFGSDGDFDDTALMLFFGEGAGLTASLTYTGYAVTASTAGNLIFQWAQNSSAAGNTILYQYSYLTGRRIG